MEEKIRKEIEDLMSGIAREYGKEVADAYTKRVMEILLQALSQSKKDTDMKWRKAILADEWEKIEWCQCGNCKPRENEPNRCQNSTWRCWMPKKDYILLSLKDKEETK